MFDMDFTSVTPSAQLPWCDDTRWDCLGLHTSWVSLESVLCLQGPNRSYLLLKHRLGKSWCITWPLQASSKGLLPSLFSFLQQCPTPSVCILHPKEMQKHRTVLSQATRKEKARGQRGRTALLEHGRTEQRKQWSCGSQQGPFQQEAMLRGKL